MYTVYAVLMQRRWRNILAGKEVWREVVRFTAGVNSWQKFGVNRFRNRALWHHNTCSASIED